MANKSKKRSGSKKAKTARATRKPVVESTTNPKTHKAIQALAKMGPSALQKKYEEVIGKKATSFNVMYLRGAIASALLQRDNGGAPTPQTKAQDNRPPVPLVVQKRDERLPPVGTVLERELEGVVHKVKVAGDGFLYDEKRFRSLSAIAKLITGTSWNGFTFFALSKPVAKASA